MIKINPIKDFKNWFEYGVKFGYSTIKIGLNLAIVYGVLWTVSQIGCNSFKKEQKYTCINNKVQNENKLNQNLEDYIINFYK